MRDLKQRLSEVRMARDTKVITGAYEDLPGWNESELKKVFEAPNASSKQLAAAIELWDTQYNSSKMLTARRDLIASYQPVSDPVRWLSHPENSAHVNFTPLLAGALDSALDAIRRCRLDISEYIGSDPVRFFTRSTTAVATAFAKLTSGFVRSNEMDGGPRRPENFEAVTRRNDRKILEATLDFKQDLRLHERGVGYLFYFVHEAPHSGVAPLEYSNRYAGYGDPLEEGLPVVGAAPNMPRVIKERFGTTEERLHHERLSEVSNMMNILRGATGV